MDGIPNYSNSDPDPIDLPHPVTTLDENAAQAAAQYKRVIRHAKTVDKMDDDIQAIQKEMRQKRALALEDLAKHRRWKAKPQKKDALYLEWQQQAVVPMERSK